LNLEYISIKNKMREKSRWFEYVNKTATDECANKERKDCG